MVENIYKKSLNENKIPLRYSAFGINLSGIEFELSEDSARNKNYNKISAIDKNMTLLLLIVHLLLVYLLLILVASDLC